MRGSIAPLFYIWHDRCALDNGHRLCAPDLGAVALAPTADLS
jgi:hypothetical protein